MFVLGVIAGTFLVAPAMNRNPQPKPVTVPAQQPPAADPFTAARAQGDAAMDAGRCQDAIAAYERALSIRFDADTATDRGVCLRQTGQREQAMAAFEFIALKEPSHWKARYNLTAMLLEAGRVDEAKKSFAILQRLGGDNEAMRALGQALSAAH